LQLAASRIDISNFFILICSPADIKEELHIANNLHGHDNVSMSCMTAELVDTKPLPNFGFYPRTSFCPLPFGSVMVDTLGAVTPCCKFTSKVGNINNTSLNEIFHNETMTTLRAQMKDGIQPNECRVCWKVEKLGVTSYQQRTARGRTRVRGGRLLG
jgi:radical SAM protein with 4Fe4S-binding SPASM domain